MNIYVNLLYDIDAHEKSNHPMTTLYKMNMLDIVLNLC